MRTLERHNEIKMWCNLTVAVGVLGYSFVGATLGRLILDPSAINITFLLGTIVVFSIVIAWPLYTSLKWLERWSTHPQGWIQERYP